MFGLRELAKRVGLTQKTKIGIKEGQDNVVGPVDTLAHSFATLALLSCHDGLLIFRRFECVKEILRCDRYDVVIVE